MNKAFFIVASLFALSASAAEIKAGRMNATKQVIELDVVYGGGCQKHDFKLEVGGCAETYPVSCAAQLIEDSHNDMCEAFIGATIQIPLSEAGLNDAYYKQAWLTISGDNNSQVKVKLP